MLTLKENLIENKNNPRESRTEESTVRFLATSFEYIDPDILNTNTPGLFRYITQTRMHAQHTCALTFTFFFCIN